jgi:hypothetical protein
VNAASVAHTGACFIGLLLTSDIETILDVLRPRGRAGQRDAVLNITDNAGVTHPVALIGTTKPDREDDAKSTRD